MKNLVNKRVGVSDTRFEVKFISPAELNPFVDIWLRGHPAGFRSAYPSRKINSVYLDTYNLCSYFENLSGASKRYKYRLRWYGNTSDHTPVQFEIKEKRNQLCQKSTYRVGKIEWSKQERWQNILSSLLTEPERLSGMPLIKSLSPVIMNSYERLYYETFCGNVRLTIDTDHRCFDQWSKQNPNFSVPSVVPNPIVVEVKYAPEHEELGKFISDSIPLRYSRHSKYLVNTNNSLPN